jgi:ABC-2 type transport system ATP-binding protein
VLLSSHILAEVEAACDRVTIIRDGRVVESGTLTELRHLRRTSISADLSQPPGGIAELPGVHDLHVDGTRIHLQVDNAELNAVLRQLTSLGVRSLVSQPPSLEELFLRHYESTPPAPDGASA